MTVLAGAGSPPGGHARSHIGSGKFVMIDDGPGFSLVPWQPALEQRLGRQITGVAMPGGGIDWTFGRSRGLGL